jgi:hypothetical protein
MRLMRARTRLRKITTNQIRGDRND